MDILSEFSEDYVTARARFVANCRAAGIASQRWINPARSIDDIELSADVALIGDPTASNLLLLVSGVHGVETLCGSGCQSGMLSAGIAKTLPPDTAVLMIHAINCWGAANLRRNNEDNVDLCRNFLDFTERPPDNPRYDAIHAAVNCADLHGPRRDAAEQVLAEYRAVHGMPGYIQALMGGQYSHPDGFSFGGTRPTWSSRTLHEIVANHGRHAQRVAVIEYHSGLGPYGHGMAVTMHTGASLERARQWYGSDVEAPNAAPAGQPSTGHRVTGHTTAGYARALPDAELTVIVLEYGTVPPNESLPVMLQDHWLHQHGDPRGDKGRGISRHLLELHHPTDPGWRRGVWDRSREVVAQALSGLSA